MAHDINGEYFQMTRQQFEEFKKSMEEVTETVDENAEELPRLVRMAIKNGAHVEKVGDLWEITPFQQIRNGKNVGVMMNSTSISSEGEERTETAEYEDYTLKCRPIKEPKTIAESDAEIPELIRQAMESGLTVVNHGYAWEITLEDYR